MTAFVLIGALLSPASWWQPFWAADQNRPTVAYFYTHEACNAALNAQAVAHGARFTGACFATGMKP